MCMCVVPRIPNWVEMKLAKIRKWIKLIDEECSSSCESDDDECYKQNDDAIGKVGLNL
jgi:hypothetical protein